MTDKDITLRVVDIVEGTTVDGPGFRTSIYFAGCEHHCRGCQNPDTWDAKSGHDMSIADLINIIRLNDFNVTFSGGDPLFQIDALVELAKAIRAEGKSIWCYTGYTYERVCESPTLSRLLPYLEVLVDGPFIESQKDIQLLFKGSANQRLIDVNKSTATAIVLWESTF